MQDDDADILVNQKLMKNRTDEVNVRNDKADAYQTSFAAFSLMTVFLDKRNENLNVILPFTEKLSNVSLQNQAEFWGVHEG